MKRIDLILCAIVATTVMVAFASMAILVRVCKSTPSGLSNVQASTASTDAEIGVLATAIEVSVLLAIAATAVIAIRQFRRPSTRQGFPLDLSCAPVDPPPVPA